MKNSSEDRKIFFISGTSKGIGRYLTEYYLDKGHTVAGCSRGQSDLEHEHYTHFSVDISDSKEVSLMFREIRKSMKYLDILINNAAINPLIAPAGLLPLSVIEKTYRVNVFATIQLCQEAAKLMSRRKFGRIINMGSIATLHNVSGESLYTSTKSSVNTFSKILARELYSSGITVNVVAPSVIKTELSDQIKEDAVEKILSRNAIKEPGKMEDISNVIDFLIKDESSSHTGQIFYLGGA